MPDDSKPEFKAAQGKHAADIQQRRNLSRLTGLTPNQVRIGLRDAAVISGPVGGNVNAPEGTIPVSLDLPPVPGQAMQFDPRPFGPQVPANPIVVAAPEGEQGTWVTPYAVPRPAQANFSDDNWDITSPPDGTDGVSIRLVTRAFHVADSDPGSSQLFCRILTFNSVGALVFISAEEPEEFVP